MAAVKITDFRWFGTANWKYNVMQYGQCKQNTACKHVTSEQ